MLENFSQFVTITQPLTESFELSAVGLTFLTQKPT
jgi:hypothetical protein